MIFFANNFFLSRKTTELAIMAMSGSGYINSTMYVLYQTFTLLLLATPLGILIGRGGVPFPMLICIKCWAFLKIHPLYQAKPIFILFLF